MSENLEKNETVTEEVIEEELEVRTDLEAGWQLERRNKIIADRDELIAFYKERIKAVEEDADFKLGFIDRALFAYFKTVKHKKTATQESYTLPGGKLVLKKQNPEYNRDDDTVIAWLKKSGATEYVKTVESLDWANLKKDATVLGDKLINADGEEIPGITVVAKPDKFTVEGGKKRG